MYKVFKYEVTGLDHFSIEMPEGARILTVQEQPGQGVQLWALVDPDNPKRIYRFLITGTGHPIIEGNLQYIGTFQFCNGSLVFDLFLVLD